MLFAFTFSVLALAVLNSTWKFTNEIFSSPFFVFLWKSKPDFYGSLSRSKKKTSKLSLFRSKYWRSANSIIESRNPNQMETNEEAEKGSKVFVFIFSKEIKVSVDVILWTQNMKIIWKTFMFYFGEIPFLISLRRNHLTEAFELLKSKVSVSISDSRLFTQEDFFMSFKSETSFSKCLRAEMRVELSWDESIEGVRKINFKLYLRCEANVSKINMVCRVRGWASFQFSIQNPQPQKQQLKKKTFMKTDIKFIYVQTLCK